MIESSAFIFIILQKKRDFELLKNAIEFYNCDT